MNIEKKTYLRPEMDIFSMGVKAGLCGLSPLIIDDDGGVTHDGFGEQLEQNIWAS